MSKLQIIRSDSPTKQLRTQTLSSWRSRGDDIELIPPNAEEFSVYGDAAVNSAARRWALDHHYMLVHGVAECAHGLLGLRRCPATCTKISDFDHRNVWANVDGAPEAFVLMAPYLKEPSAELHSYARHHGLRIDQFSDDGWYGRGSIPIRLTLNAQDTHLGALEELLLVLNLVAPTTWPTVGV